MKRLVLFSTLFIVLSSVANAQTTFNRQKSPVKFSVGPEVAFPIGNNGVEYNIGYGGTGQLEIGASPKISVTGLVGYIHFSYKTVFTSGNQGFIPLLAGVKYYISNRAFAHLQAGAAFAGTTVADAANNGYLDKGTYFAYSPGLGHKFGRNMEGEVKFLGISNSKHSHVNSLGLRFAITF